MFAAATIEKVHEAMAAVPTASVKEWCAKHLGQTLFSQRKEAYGAARIAQQNVAESIS